MIEIWGHRGAYCYAPENTLTSFQMAAEMGASGVELDIQLSRDSEIVVIHDETVDRTSNGHGYVKDFTLSQMKKLNVNKRGLTQPHFMEIPTLTEVLELLKPTQLKVNIELKTGIVFYNGIEKKALDIVYKHDMLGRVVWSSFNHYSLQTIRQLEPKAETALLCGSGILTTLEECEKTGAKALHPDVKQLQCPQLVEDCRNRRIKIRPWTVNEPDEFMLARELGVDGVFTNRIDIAKAELAGEKVE